MRYEYQTFQRVRDLNAVRFQRSGNQFHVTEGVSKITRFFFAPPIFARIRRAFSQLLRQSVQTLRNIPQARFDPYFIFIETR